MLALIGDRSLPSYAEAFHATLARSRADPGAKEGLFCIPALKGATTDTHQVTVEVMEGVEVEEAAEVVAAEVVAAEVVAVAVVAVAEEVVVAEVVNGHILQPQDIFPILLSLRIRNNNLSLDKSWTCLSEL